MNTRKVATEFRMAHWSQVFKERKESGLSIRAFCEQSEIKEKTYYYWQRKLREAACAEMLANSQSKPVEVDDSTIPTGWAVCEAAPIDTSKTLPIEINGCKVLASADTDSELLARTCKVLMSIC